MKFGLISLDFRRVSLETCFRTAARCGFSAVEIWGGRPHAWPYDVDAAAARRILSWKSRYGLELPMYTPNAIGLPVNLCSSMEAERGEGLAYFKKSVEAASRLEIPRMLLVADHPGYETDPDDAKNWFAQAVAGLADFAKPYGVTISVEPLTPLESPVVTTTEDCFRLMKQVDRENIDFVLDVVPPTVACEPVSGYFRRLGLERIRHVHICNTDGKTDAHLQLDTGVLSIPEILRTLRDAKYNGYVIAELYSVSAWDPECTAAKAARLLREYGEELIPR
jgi:fructoselysine 3-epimerase